MSLLSIILIRGEANPQVFRNIKTPREQQYGFYYFPEELHSASGLHSQKVKLTNFNFPSRTAGYERSDPIDNAPRFYDNFDESFERNLKGYQKRPAENFLNLDANDRAGAGEKDLTNNNYDDYKTSQTTHILGPHQIETIQSEHFHKHVPSYDISDFQHHEKEKHGEVHYHQHKHIHKHEHKQEHIHQHKQDHQHKHIHNQQHKHQHHSEHKHGHEHKHDHHQQHKHDHHQEHKHDHHHDHKHGHNHGHKHQHRGNHKHGHKHHHSKH